MLSHFLWGSSIIFKLFFKFMWFVCNLISAGIPWIVSILCIIFIISKFFQIKNPKDTHLLNLLGIRFKSFNENNFAVANRGADYDAPENSKAALQKCIELGYYQILLDAALSACEQIVMVSPNTLKKAGYKAHTIKYSHTELLEIDLSKIHPLRSEFEEQHIFTLTDLMDILKIQSDLAVFLYINDNSLQMFEKIKEFILKYNYFTKRIIIVSTSAKLIYQLRKLQPELICGLWTKKTCIKTLIKIPSIFLSIYESFFRNFIVPIIGLNIVFINKEEFNLNVSNLWKKVGVNPIVYYINSPNEKRYFQRTLKTQYLTDSLRSEPQNLIKENYNFF